MRLIGLLIGMVSFVLLVSAPILCCFKNDKAYLWMGTLVAGEILVPISLYMMWG